MMRVRWYHAPLLYGLGVVLGALAFEARALILYGVSPSLNLVALALLGAYALPPAGLVWILLIPVTWALEARPRLAAAIPLTSGLAVSLLGFLAVLPGVLRGV